MVKIQMSEIRTTKIDGQEFVTLTDYLRLKAEKQELEYLWDINEELKEENKKLNNDYLIAQEEIKELKRQIKWLINDSKKVWESLIQAYKDLEHYDKEDENLS